MDGEIFRAFPFTSDSFGICRYCHHEHGSQNKHNFFHHNDYNNIILYVFPFLLAKLRKSIQKALGSMEEMMAEGESVKLGFMF